MDRHSRPEASHRRSYNEQDDDDLDYYRPRDRDIDDHRRRSPLRRSSIEPFGGRAEMNDYGRRRRSPSCAGDDRDYPPPPEYRRERSPSYQRGRERERGDRYYYEESPQWSRSRGEERPRRPSEESHSLRRSSNEGRSRRKVETSPIAERRELKSRRGESPVSSAPKLDARVVKLEEKKPIDPKKLRANLSARPDLRLVVGSTCTETLDKTLRHDDVVMVPELLGRENNMSLYYELKDEIEKIPVDSRKVTRRANAVCVEQPSKTIRALKPLIDKACTYFGITLATIGVGLMWLQPSAEDRILRRDFMAFTDAKTSGDHNIALVLSLGANRDIAFVSNPTDDSLQGSVQLQVMAANNSVMSVGRDVNIRWMRGARSVDSEQDDKGTLVLNIWGKSNRVVEQEGSPALIDPNAPAEPPRTLRVAKLEPLDNREEEDSYSDYDSADYSSEEDRYDRGGGGDRRRVRRRSSDGRSPPAKRPRRGKTDDQAAVTETTVFYITMPTETKNKQRHSRGRGRGGRKSRRKTES